MLHSVFVIIFVLQTLSVRSVLLITSIVIPLCILRQSKLLIGRIYAMCTFTVISNRHSIHFTVTNLNTSPANIQWRI